MAETSGFATDLAQSAYLSTTMRRAIAAAQQRSHRYVTLEHLLLALLDDPDAQSMLESLRVDKTSMKARATDTVNRNLATLYTPGQFDLRASYKVERVLQTASDDARRLNCTEVDAAFVLAALAHEMDSPAADIIKATGLSFSNAMTWLYTNRGSSRAIISPSAAAASSMASQAAEVHADDGMHDLDDLAFDLEFLDEEDTPPPPAPARSVQLDPRPADAAPRAQPQLQKPVNGAVRGPAPEAVSSARAELPPLPTRRAPQPVPPAPAPRRDAPARAAEAAAPLREQLAPLKSEQRPEIKVPSPSRLDEMRVRPAGAPSAAPSPPAPAGKSAKKKAKRPGNALAPSGAKQAAPAPATAGTAATAPPPGQMRRQRRQSWLETQAGKLIENIPRRMRVAVPERVEVRISREETDAITKGFDGRGEVIRHDVLVSQAMSVMLRAPDGGFVIETLSPETQWTSDGADHRSAENYGRWRWAVTPVTTGNHRLQLIVAARSVDENGMTGDTVLPDQIISVRVRTNYMLSIKRGLAWLVVMAAGGVVTELAVRALKIFEPSGG